MTVAGGVGPDGPVTPDAVTGPASHRVPAPVDPGAPGRPPTARVRRRRRWLAWTLVVLGVLVVLFLAVTARLFVWPPTDAPTRVDAILTLGGDPGQLRAKKGVALAEAGYAPVVVVSRGGYPEAPCPTATHGVEVICFRADPLDTRGEVEFASRLAAERHWTSLLVVPERSQSTRARMLLERCTAARIVVVPVQDPADRLLYDIAYEWAATAKALVVRRSC